MVSLSGIRAETLDAAVALAAQCDRRGVPLSLLVAPRPHSLMGWLGCPSSSAHALPRITGHATCPSSGGRHLPRRLAGGAPPNVGPALVVSSSGVSCSPREVRVMLAVMTTVLDDVAVGGLVGILAEALEPAVRAFYAQLVRWGVAHVDS